MYANKNAPQWYPSSGSSVGAARYGQCPQGGSPVAYHTIKDQTPGRDRVHLEAYLERGLHSESHVYAEVYGLVGNADG